MPALKRPCADTSQEGPTLKRRGDATEASSDDSRNPAVQKAVEENTLERLLQECSQKQQYYINCLEKCLLTWEDRFKRIEPYLRHQLITEKDKVVVRGSTKKLIKLYEKEIDAYNQKQAVLEMIVKEGSEQEDQLEKVVRDVVNYKGYQLHDPMHNDEIGANLYGSFTADFEKALHEIPTTSRDDSKMKDIPKLERNDLDKIVWPKRISEWKQYSQHWNREVEKAVECRKQNERILVLEGRVEKAVEDYKAVQAKKNIISFHDENRNCQTHEARDVEQTALSEKLKKLIEKCYLKKASIEKLEAKKRVLNESTKQRETLFKSVQEEMNRNLLECSVCVQPLTNGEGSLRCPQQFGSCGHTACATCMERFKAQDYPFRWTCYQCRAPSDKILTNWALMDLVKEIPGQPQREVVRLPEAVPIVPAGWRLEPAVPPDVIRQLQALIFGLLGEAHVIHRINQALAAPAPVAPAPAAPAPVPWAPVAHPLGPGAPAAPEPQHNPDRFGQLPFHQQQNWRAPVQVPHFQNPFPARQFAWALQPVPVVGVQQAPPPQAAQQQMPVVAAQPGPAPDEDAQEDEEEQVEDEQEEDEDQEEDEQDGDVDDEEEEEEEEDDDDADAILEAARRDVAALDDDLEIIEEHIRAPPQVRQFADEDGIEYIVLD